MTELALPRLSPAPISPGHLRALPDTRLSRLAADGDERAFTAIVRRHQNGLYRYCVGLLGHPEDAGDATQATLTKALLALPAKKAQVPLKPWLYRIAHNEAISIRRRRPTSHHDDDHSAGATRGADEHAFDRHELRQLVDDLLALPERQRAALVMRELSGFGYGEIATSLGTSAAGAKQTVYEARVALHERAQGRETSCASIRAEVSAGDRRALRARRVKAHLNSCAGCREFEIGMRRRGDEIQALAPLSGLGLLGVLKSLLGGGGGGGSGGALVGASGGAATVSATGLKSAAALAALLVAAGTTEIRHHAGAPAPVGGGSLSAQAGAPPTGGAQVALPLRTPHRDAAAPLAQARERRTGDHDSGSPAPRHAARPEPASPAPSPAEHGATTGGPERPSAAVTGVTPIPAAPSPAPPAAGLTPTVGLPSGHGHAPQLSSFVHGGGGEGHVPEIVANRGHGGHAEPSANVHLPSADAVPPGQGRGLDEATRQPGAHRSEHSG